MNALYNQNASLWNNAYQQQMATQNSQAQFGLNAANSLMSNYNQLSGLNSNLTGTGIGANSNLISGLNSTNTGLTGNVIGANSGLTGNVMSNNTSLANTSANAYMQAGANKASNTNDMMGGLAGTIGGLPSGTLKGLFS